MKALTIIATIIRIAIEILLIFLIYQETGIWTAVFVFAVTVRHELQDIRERHQSKLNEETISAFERMNKYLTKQSI